MLTYLVRSRASFRRFIPLALLAVLASSRAEAPTTLKQAFHDDFHIGVAMSAAQITGRDPQATSLIEAQFDSISPENVLKWGNVHPASGTYAFAIPDQYVALGEKNHMWTVGHTLVWHNQTPAWVFQNGDGSQVDRATLLQRMHDHIQTVVGRYRGRIQSWDVVNEVIAEDGTLRQTMWLKIIGPDYVAKAFQFAHEADPAAQLTYNDYSLENETKRNGALKLVRQLKEQGVPINAIGLQCHQSLRSPAAQATEDTIDAFENLGMKVNISELDVDVLPRATREQGADISLQVKPDAARNPYPSDLPADVEQQLAQRYMELFRIFVKHHASISRVTFWGLTDRQTWLNNWPVRGRTNYPLLFDRDGRPKPAFYAVLQAATSSKAHHEPTRDAARTGAVQTR